MSQKRKVVIIEPENFDPKPILSPSTSTAMIDPNTGKESKCGVKFNIRGNRYLVDPKAEKAQEVYTDYAAGTNNITEDLLWKSESPRMTLIDNCIRKDDYGPDAKYNFPPGLPSDSGRYKLNAPELVSNGKVPQHESSINTPDFSNHQWDTPITTGIESVPDEIDEITKQVR